MSWRWRLFVAAWLLIAAFTRTGTSSSHEWSRLGTVESIVERGNFWLEESKFRGTRDKIFRAGHYYSHQPPLLAALASPVYGVIHKFGLRVSNSAPIDRAYYLFVLFTNGVAFAATVVGLWSVFTLLGAPPPIASVAALALPFGTWLFPYGVVSNNHGVSAALLAWLIYTLLAVELKGLTAGRGAALGGLLGLLTAIEVIPIVSFVPAVAMCLWLWRRHLASGHLQVTAMVFALPLIAHAVLNIPITGDVIPAGFHSELFQFEGTTFTAAELTGSIKHRSAVELWSYAQNALFTGKGFFTLAPVMLIGLVVGVGGWRWWARARAAHLALLAGSAASLGASLLTTNNLGGAAVGFRHATYLAPAFLVLLAPVVCGRGRALVIASWALIAIAAASAGVLWWHAVHLVWADLRVAAVFR